MAGTKAQNYRHCALASGLLLFCIGLFLTEPESTSPTLKYANPSRYAHGNQPLALKYGLGGSVSHQRAAYRAANGTIGPTYKWPFLGRPEGPALLSTSQRWSGYAVPSAQYGAGSQFTEVDVSISVPDVRYVPYAGRPALEAVAIWTGIGGYPNSDQTLIQAGFTVTAAPGVLSTYYPWYEMIPQTSQNLTGCTYGYGGSVVPCTVFAGDTFGVEIECISSQAGCPPVNSPPYYNGQNISIFVTDNRGECPRCTMRWYWNSSFYYNSSLGSDEWIVEAPQVSGNPVPLAGFPPVVLSTADSFNITNDNNGIQLNDPNGGTAVPCVASRGPHMEGYTFQVQYGGTCSMLPTLPKPVGP
jgi:hypothetical protein